MNMTTKGTIGVYETLGSALAANHLGGSRTHRIHFCVLWLYRYEFIVLFSLLLPFLQRLGADDARNLHHGCRELYST